MLKVVVILSLAAALCGQVRAAMAPSSPWNPQTPSYGVDFWREAEGLAQSRIRAIAQTRPKRANRLAQHIITRIVSLRIVDVLEILHGNVDMKTFHFLPPLIFLTSLVWGLGQQAAEPSAGFSKMQQFSLR